jgi:cysteine-rich repeat protein
MTSHDERRAPGELVSVALLLVLQACAGRVDNSSESLPLASNTGGVSGVTTGLAFGGSSLSNSAGGAYALPSGGAQSSDVGGSTGASTCGNGRVDGTEQCDDGNLVNGDGCNQYCKVQLGPHCGDGILQGPEECDLGSLNGKYELPCTANCRIEPWLP